MRRMVQTSCWVIGSAVVVALFVVAGGWSAAPLRWADLPGWLGQARPEEAVVEIARWTGIVIAGYVLVVASVVLLADLAATLRLLPVARGLNRLGSVAALPVLKRRLLHATTATAFTMSSLTIAMTGGGVSAAPTATTQAVDDIDVVALPAGLSIDAFAGFDVTALPTVDFSPTSSGGTGSAEVVVEAGDTLWDLALERYGTADAQIVGRLAEINDLADPGLIFRGQSLDFPDDLWGVPTVAPAPAVDFGAASWGVHRIVSGDTLWDILNDHYGQVDADLVWTVAAANGIENPSAIPIGTDVHLPPLGNPTGPPTIEPTPPALDAPTVAIVEAPPTGGTEVAPPPTDPAVASSGPAAESQPSPKAPIESVPFDPPTGPAIGDTAPSTVGHVTVDPADVDHGDDRSLAVLGGAASIALATGLAEMSRRRRRNRWAVPRSPQAVAATSETPAGIEEAADLTLVEWVAASLARLVSDGEIDGDDVFSVEFDEHTLSVTARSAHPVAPSPWWATNGGWVWNLSRTAWLRPREDDPAVALPGLVTFGMRHGRQFLVNLNAVGSVAVDGPGAASFVASVALEFATGDTLSRASVRLVDLRLENADTSEALKSVDVDEALRTEAGPGRVVVSVLESDSGAAPGLLQRSRDHVGYPVVVLGASELATAADIRIDPSGGAHLSPAEIEFDACMVSSEIILAASAGDGTDVADDRHLADPERESNELVVASNVVSFDSRSAVKPPTTILRVFAARLPSFEPVVPGIGATQMRIVSALESFEGGRAPARIAERLGLAEKTVRTHASSLFAADPPVIYSDREIWTLASGICSDVDWMNDLAIAARQATTRHEATRALAACWDMFERVTGPAYAGGGESKQWNWVHDRTDGTSPSDDATRALLEAITIAVECWDDLAAETLDDLRSPASLVQILLRLERATGLVEPWQILRAATRAARRATESSRQQIAMRLAQLAHGDEVDVPLDLVTETVGSG